MRSSLLTKTIVALFNAPTRFPRTIAIEGAPGGGKTDLVHQAGNILGVPVVELHMPTMLVEDFGIPYPSADSNTFDYKLPWWFPEKGKAPDRMILLFDDRNQAPADLQKVLANICQARTLHGHKIPDRCMIISTGNRQQDRAGANRVLGHLRNRETAIPYETNLDDWCSWAADNGVPVEVTAFIRFRPDQLHNYDPDKDANPTPRSWVDGVGRVLGHIPREAEFEAFSGAVGEGSAAEFRSFVEIYRQLPDPDVVLAKPEKAEVPRDLATLYALIGALAQRVNGTTFPNFVRFLDRCPAERADLGVFGVSTALRKDPDIGDCKAFSEWAVKNQEFLY